MRRWVPAERVQMLWSGEGPPALLIAHSLLRLPALCVPVPQGPFPQPLSGPLNRKCEEAAHCS